MLLLTPPKAYRRGYPVAVLVGLKEDQAVLWKIFSNVAKPDRTLRLNGYRNDQKALYNFHESIVNAFRPTMKEGVKSIILASPMRTNYAAEFLKHIREHHAWLTQGQSKATFAEMAGSANSVHEVTTLTRTPEFSQIVGETTMEETENLIELLEKRLNSSNREPLVLYSVEEIENKVLGPWLPGKAKPEYLLITDTCILRSRQKNRLQRLIQIAINREIKTRTVKTDSPAGKRLMQLGGIVCIMRPE